MYSDAFLHCYIDLRSHHSDNLKIQRFKELNLVIYEL